MVKRKEVKAEGKKVFAVITKADFAKMQEIKANTRFSVADQIRTALRSYFEMQNQNKEG